MSVRTSDGRAVEGFLHGAVAERGLSVVLKFAAVVGSADAPVTMWFDQKDIVSVSSLGGIDITKLSGGGATSRFETDTGISGARGAKDGRDLVRWTPDDDASGAIESLDAVESKGSGGAWNQFEANERLYGVKTSFELEDYTTKLDRSGADFEARQRQAARLAAEIEGQSSDNVHLKEERGQAVEQDEETLYSSVGRSGPSPAGPPKGKRASPASTNQSWRARPTDDLAGVQEQLSQDVTRFTMSETSRTKERKQMLIKEDKDRMRKLPPVSANVATSPVTAPVSEPAAQAAQASAAPAAAPAAAAAPEAAPAAPPAEAKPKPKTQFNLNAPAFVPMFEAPVQQAPPVAAFMPPVDPYGGMYYQPQPLMMVPPEMMQNPMQPYFYPQGVVPYPPMPQPVVMMPTHVRASAP
mgnify:CR=1 FL=1